MVKQTRKNGFTLIELMVGTGIVLAALGGLLGAFNYYAGLRDNSGFRVMAMNAARAEVEEMRSMDFDDIVSTTFDPNGEDDNLNGALDAGEDGNNNGILDSPFDGSGTIEVSDAAGSIDNLKDLRVVVSWRDARGRIIGEDNGAGAGIALDGVLHSDEDVNGNNQMDSPALIITAVVRRN